MAEGSSKRQILGVAELNRRVRALLEQNLGKVWVEGECSNVSAPSSGHVYFTLKDEQAQLQAAWFRGRRGPGALMPADGMKVRVYGQITAYERGGQVQVIVETAEDAGRGDLQKRFEELKERLRKEGLFERSRKQALPMLPRHIGVVTSPTGAAIRDILNVLMRRFPDRRITLFPVPVQGEGAAPRIAKALDFVNAQYSVDVLIVGRGGGSLEDLWPFNEEVVARAIARSRIPIISAVGHEIDFCISDFVADLRAPTPSAGAELVIGRKVEFEQQVQRLEQRLAAALRRRQLEYRSRLERAKGHDLFHEPQKLLQRYRAQVAALDVRMRQSLRSRVTQPQRRLGELGLQLRHQLERKLQEDQRHVDELGLSLERRMQQELERRQQRLKQAEGKLRILNPYQVLDRGFSITRLEDGSVIEDAEQVETGTLIETLTRKGSLRSRVE